MNRVGKVYYRSNIRGGNAIMIINKLDGETYYRDIWGINGDNFKLYIDDDIIIKELEYLITGNNEIIVIDINEISEEIKQKGITCLFKSEIESRS